MAGVLLARLTVLGSRPGMCGTFCWRSVDGASPCLPSSAQVVGDALKPHLEPLSASQMKLLVIYLDKARGGGRLGHALL